MSTFFSKWKIEKKIFLNFFSLLVALILFCAWQSRLRDENKQTKKSWALRLGHHKLSSRGRFFFSISPHMHFKKETAHRFWWRCWCCCWFWFRCRCCCCGWRCSGRSSVWCPSPTHSPWRALAAPRPMSELGLSHNPQSGGRAAHPVSLPTAARRRRDKLSVTSRGRLLTGQPCQQSCSYFGKISK